MRTIQREIVGALIFSSDNKILLGRKDPAKGGVYLGCWHIPGGGIEPGESSLQGLTREIHEEVGIIITPETAELVDDADSATTERTMPETGERVLCEMHFNAYTIKLNKPAEKIVIHLNDDLVESAWFDPAHLGSLALTPPGKKLFTKLGYIIAPELQTDP